MRGQPSWCPSGRTFAACSDPGGHRVGAGRRCLALPSRLHLCVALWVAVSLAILLCTPPLHFYPHDMKENKYRLMKVKESSPG